MLHGYTSEDGAGEEEVADSCPGMTTLEETSGHGGAPLHAAPPHLLRASPIAMPYSASSSALSKLSEEEEDVHSPPLLSPALQVGFGLPKTVSDSARRCVLPASPADPRGGP